MSPLRRNVEVLSEHRGAPRERLGPRACRALERLDYDYSRRAGERIFDWSRKAEVRARNWVGVVEVPGLSVEILPKTAPGDSDGLARRNLLCMLHASGAIPSAARGVAAIATESMPLLEAIVMAFAQRLVEELIRGPQRSYVVREEQLPVLRGKLLVAEHILHSRGLEGKVYVQFDELVSDTPLNRVLKAGCELLARRVRSAAALHLLERALMYLSEVRATRIGDAELRGVTFDRTNERFRDVFTFCRLVLSGQSPSQRAGEQPTFTVLFPMERVFEAFVAALVLRNREVLGVGHLRVRAQSSQRWLARDEAGDGRFRLRPDLVLERQGGAAALILDTKWKTLVPDAVDRNGGVASGDVYQLFAYATRYECPDNILLFPRVAGVNPKHLWDPGSGRSMRIETLDLGRDLQRERAGVLGDLRRVLRASGPK